MQWTEAMFGFGARTIAVIDAAAASPFAQLSMIPLLTLIAVYAPPGHRATWFALMASFMNLALVAGQLQTKYLNQLFVVERGAYGELGVAADRGDHARLPHPDRGDRAVRAAGLTARVARHRSAARRGDRAKRSRGPMS